MNHPSRGSVYYKNTGKLAFASKLSLRVREKLFDVFINTMKPQSYHKILDVGVTCDQIHPESNYFERRYPYKERITCVGTEDGSHLEKTYPGLKFIKVRAGDSLPFQDKEFDFAISNAVIEHVGSECEQRAFVKEVRRVSKAFFVSTPNRWFPIEHHTGIPFLHWLPKRLYRKILSLLGEDYWSREENLNALSARSLAGLFCGAFIGRVRLFGLSSNLIAYSLLYNV